MANDKTLLGLPALGASATPAPGNLVAIWDAAAAAGQRTKSTRYDVLAGHFGRLRGFYNVKDPLFGAKGDGVANDTVAIQAALDAATAAGIVFFPPGIFQTSNIKVPYGVQVVGSGWQNTLIRAITGTAGALITDKVTVAGQGSTGIWISDLEVRGLAEAGLGGIKLGYGGLGSDQFNFLGGISRIVVRSFNGDGIDVKCNVGELRDVYINLCNICLRTSGTVLRAYGLALQQSTGGRELEHAAKDSIFHHLHVETNAGPGDISLNVAAGGNRTYFDGVTWSGQVSKVAGTIINFVAGVLDCSVRHLAINLDQAGSGYTNAIVDANRLPNAILKTQLADPLYLPAYSQVLTEFQQTPGEAVLVSGVDARDGNVVTTLTAARLVGAPTSPQPGQYLEFLFIQDAVGGRAVTWNAVFKVSWSDTGNTANKRSTIGFRYDGTNWNQCANQTPYI